MPNRAYIDAEQVKDAICDCAITDDEKLMLIRRINRVPTADVVSRDAFNRILAENDDMRELLDMYGGEYGINRRMEENDTMRTQLAEIGKKPGDDMSDVRRIREEWIPTSDYLPKVREPVIVAIKWDDDGSVDRGVGRYTGRPDYFGNTWRVYEAELGELNKGYQVTHWMPFPSLPEELK